MNSLFWPGTAATMLSAADVVASAILQRRGFVEVNPLLGKHPSDLKFVVSFLIGVALLWLAVYLLLWPIVWLVLLIEGYEATRNSMFLFTNH